MVRDTVQLLVEREGLVFVLFCVGVTFSLPFLCLFYCLVFRSAVGLCTRSNAKTSSATDREESV